MQDEIEIKMLNLIENLFKENKFNVFIKIFSK